METGSENSISVVKDYQKEGSWVPVTPVKSRSTTLQPICSDRLTNQTAQNNLLEPEKTSEGNPLSETNWLESEVLQPCLQISSQDHTVVACCCSKDFININGEINKLDAILRTKSEAQRNSVGLYNNFSTDDADRWQYVPFAQLLALADTSTATPAHAPLQNQVNAARSSFVSSSNPQVAKSPFMSTIENPSLTSQDLLLGSKFQLSSSYASDICHCNEIRQGTEQLEQLTNHAVAELANQLLEIHNPDKGGSHGTETNKTPQQKTRRKRHRPKVVIEGQPKHPYKPRTPTPASPKIPQTGKRKYVRRNGLNKPATPTSEVTGEATDQTPALKVRKSCRRSLNFDFKYEANEESSSYRLSSNFDYESHEHNYLTRTRSRSTAQVRERMEEATVKTQVHIDNDITRSENQLLEGSMPMPDRQTIGPTTPSKTIPANKKMITVSNNGFARGKCQITFSEETHDKEVSTAQLINNNAQSLARSPNDSNCSSKEFFIMAKQARGIKRKHPSMIDEVNLWTVNVIEGHNPSEHAHTSISPFNEYYNRLPYSQFPAVYKKKRTEKGRTSVRCETLSTMTKAENHERQLQPFIDVSTGSLISEISCSIPAAHVNAKDIPRTEDMQDIQHPLKCMLAFSDKERLTKKRSKVATRLRSLASLNEISKQLPSEIHGFMQGCQNPEQSNTWIEALVTDARVTMAKGKKTKRINSVPSNYNHQKFVTESTGPPARRQRNMSVNAIAEQFEHLNINAQSSQAPYEESNALVPYNQRFNGESSLALNQMNRSLVSLEGSFIQVRKQRPRPKVELDDETNRVWRLLLENINSEGIDGIDQEKAKWWEEERRVFRGRADSFIARMHLVQGDRRFSQWKGSVVDSVVGVFLTQNVSDHLSSSAFMSLAAHFPLKSKSVNGQPHEERASISVKEPEICILDADDTIEWHEEQPNQPPFDQSFFKLQNMKYREEMEVSNQNLYVEGRCNDVKAPDNSRRKLLDSSKSSPKMYSQSAANISGTQTTGVDAITIEDQSEMEDALSSQNSVVSSQNSMNISFAQTDEKLCSCTQNNSEAEQPAWSNTSDSFGGSTFVELLQRAGSITYNVGYDLMNVNMFSTKSKYYRSKGMPFDSPKQDKNQLDDLSTSSRLDMPSRIYQPNMTLDSGVHELGCLETLEEENCTSEQSALSAESISQTIVKEMKTLSSQEQPKTPNGNNNPRNNYRVELNKFSTSQKIVEHSKNEIELQSQGCVQEEQQVFKNSETLDVGGTTTVLHKHMLVGQSLNDLVGMNTGTSKPRRGRQGKEKQSTIDWDILRKQAQVNGRKEEKTENTMDSLDWEAVRQADVNEIAKTIKERGMNNRLAERIKDFLNRLVRDHGSVDLEWLRDVPPDKAKEYLLSIRGLGLKSVECVRLLTLHHLAFPVDTNVGRIAVRLGWVPLQPLPESLQLHLLELYPVLESIQKYLWPRLCKLDQRTLYELHYQMITFGKVFCTKSKPNCNACPMRGECRHFASAFASARLALPAPEDKSIVCGTETNVVDQSPVGVIHPLLLPISQSNKQELLVRNSDPIVEVPTTPEPIVEVPGSPEPEPEPEQTQILKSDIEDTICEDPDEIPTIKLNMVEFTQNLQNYMQQNMEIQEGDMSRALVSLTPEAASIPTPKLKNVSRLRTEHIVYELPDSHPLLEGLGKREPDDPSPYLLAIWTPGETADSIQPPERRCNFQDFGELCVEKTCFSCNSIREANSQTVRGTLLIPCRTAMRGSFPLNGTYFQVNEVFADHESSLSPIHVPRDWLWNLPRRTVYFGTSIPTIFKGLPTNGIQYCFWRGFVCVRGFDQKTRAPRPLIARLHFPASKLTKARGIADENYAGGS